MKLHKTILSSVIILIGDLHITLMLQLDYTLLVSFIYKNTSHSFTKFGFKDCKKKKKKEKGTTKPGVLFSSSLVSQHWCTYLTGASLTFELELLNSWQTLMIKNIILNHSVTAVLWNLAKWPYNYMHRHNQRIGYITTLQLCAVIYTVRQILRLF